MAKSRKSGADKAKQSRSRGKDSQDRELSASELKRVSGAGGRPRTGRGVHA